MTRTQRNDNAPQPRCFTAAQWLVWRTAAKHYLCGAMVHHCTDCTPEHQAAMTAQQLCDNPHGEATRDKDGFIQITPPTKEKP